MKYYDYAVYNRYNGHLLGQVRATSKKVAESMAHALFGCYTSVEV